MNVIDAAEWRRRLSLPAIPKLSYEGISAEEREQFGLEPPKEQLYYEIDAAVKLYLQAEENDLAQQFAESFKRAWDNIAENDRDRMVSAWKGKGIVPVISMDDNAHLIAGYEGITRTFQFHTEGVRLALADGMADLVVGHELGHALCDAIPDSLMQMTPTMENRNEILEGRENEANLKAMDWGFDMVALTDWGNSKRADFVKITGSSAYNNPFTPVPYHPTINPCGPKVYVGSSYKPSGASGPSDSNNEE